MPLMIASFAFNFNNFVLIALLTNGRPDFLDTSWCRRARPTCCVAYTYRIAFQDSGQSYGLAARDLHHHLRHGRGPLDRATCA